MKNCMQGNGLQFMCLYSARPASPAVYSPVKREGVQTMML